MYRRIERLHQYVSLRVSRSPFDEAPYRIGITVSSGVALTFHIFELGKDHPSFHVLTILCDRRMSGEWTAHQYDDLSHLDFGFINFRTSLTSISHKAIHTVKRYSQLQ